MKFVFFSLPFLTAGIEIFENAAFIVPVDSLHAYTVKLARAKLPAKAAGELIRRKKYLRIQVKISAGTDCLIRTSRWYTGTVSLKLTIILSIS